MNNTLYQLCCSAGAASDRGTDPVTTANEAYGMHSTLPVSMDENHLPSAGSVYERIDTECVKYTQLLSISCYYPVRLCAGEG